jgi:Tfp pilus assembly protein PilF
VVLCLLLVVVTLALYNSTSSHPFVNYDDDRYITDNLHVRAGLTWDSVRWAFTSFDEANWHPLTWLSHELDCQLFKLNPAGHHYTNVLLQSVNVVLLFLVLEWATGFTWRSLLVALLFAVHPVNVESVAWVAERKNLLSMMFLLLGLAAYGRYVRRPHIKAYLPVAVLFACGLMAKPMVITFPFILLLWDYWPLQRMGVARAERRRFASLALEKLPLFALCAGSAVITMLAQSEGGAVRSVREFPFADRLGNAVVAYARYLLDMVWPARLAPMYPYSAQGLAPWQVALAAALIAAITILVIRYRKHRYLPVGWFWFLGTLVPMIGLVQVGAQAMADRYAYLSFVGLFIIVCWGAADLSECQRVPKSWLAVATLAVLVCLSSLTYRQLSFWKDNVTLWQHTLNVTKQNFVAEDNLGGALLAEARVEPAMIHFRRAVQINPGDPVGNLNLAAYDQQHGKLQESITLYQGVLRMTPDYRLRATVFSNLGSAYRNLHQYDLAQQSYEQALQLVAGTPHAWIGLGLIAQKTGDLQAAANDYSRAMDVQPTDVGYLLLAQALAKSGKSQEADEARGRAQELSPHLNEAQKAADVLLNE